MLAYRSDEFICSFQLFSFFFLLNGSLYSHRSSSALYFLNKLCYDVSRRYSDSEKRYYCFPNKIYCALVAACMLGWVPGLHLRICHIDESNSSNIVQVSLKFFIILMTLSLISFTYIYSYIWITSQFQKLTKNI